MKYLILNQSFCVVDFTYDRQEAEQYMLDGYIVEAVVL